MEVGVHEAKTQLSQLLRRVAAGEEVIIARGGKPIAKLVPYDTQMTRILGRDVGLFEVPEDFNRPLPPEIQRHFES